MIIIHITFHKPRVSGSLVTAVKPEAKYRFCGVTVLVDTIKTYFWEINCCTKFLDAKKKVGHLLPFQEVAQSPC
jgi:hypothetical protein